MKGIKMNEKPVVLLVDDDEDFNAQNKLLLANAGYKVITAAGRKEAIALAEKEHVDCAVVDLMMEEMDGGFVLAHHLRKCNKNLPIIIVTAVTSETGIDFGTVNAGEKNWIKADTVLAKPIRFEQLEREIKRLLA
jgi:CheY-like chemotaxis protein